MTLVVEDGTVVAGAESYATVAEYNAYWNARGGPAHTDTKATGQLTMANQPSDAETIVIGSQTYTFKNSLASSGDVLIGATLADTRDNLKRAINGEDGGGTKYHASTPTNTDVTAAAFASDVMTVTAITGGTASNSTALSETLTALDDAWSTSTLTGGEDTIEDQLRLGTQYLDNTYRGRWKGTIVDDDQVLAWPRDGVIDEEDRLLDSNVIPTNLKRALYEAANQAASDLHPDIAVTDSSIKRESKQLGPLKKDITYQGGKRTEKKFTKVRHYLRGYVTARSREIHRA